MTTEHPLAHLPRPIVRTRRLRVGIIGRAVVVLVLIVALTAGGAISTNALGAGDKFQSLVDRVALFIDPPPDRPTAPTVDVPLQRSDPPEDASLPPDDDPGASSSPLPAVSLAPGASAAPTPPARRPVDVKIVSSPAHVFASEIKNDQCAAAGVQSVLAILKLADTSDQFQNELESRIGEWDSWRDSHNGGWGPAAMVKALEAYGASGYQVRAYGSRADALFDAAVRIRTYHKPVILLAWRGAHTWVMSGYRATADPTLFQDATVRGAYIIDPWYPRISSIWGPSDPPGTFQDAAEMRRNYLPWKRPEGLYPERDGKFIAVVPTTPLKSGG